MNFFIWNNVSKHIIKPRFFTSNLKNHKNNYVNAKYPLHYRWKPLKVHGILHNVAINERAFPMQWWISTSVINFGI